jgi:hypothetical protein
VTGELPWTKLDEGFHSHSKVADIEPELMLAAIGLHCLALSWCGEQLTDGVLPKGQPARLAGGSVVLLIDELIRVGLWERRGTGYQIHDYLSFNPSREQWEAEQQQKSEAGKRGAALRWGEREIAEPMAPAIAPAIASPITERCSDSDSDSVSDTESDSEEDIVAQFHAFCPSLPKIRAMNDARKGRVQRALRAFGRDGIRELFVEAEASDFLSGRTGKWQASFDWLLKPEHIPKVLEGNYHNRNGGMPANVAAGLSLVAKYEAEEARCNEAK